MVEYEKAIAIWLGDRICVDPDDISNVEFDTIKKGFCETCEYTTMGLIFQVKGREGTLVLEYVPPAEFVREVSEIIQSERT